MQKNTSNKIKIDFIMVCHGLHDYGGHEYMYTKGILENLPDNFNCIIWARKDINPKIQKELNAKGIFSKVNYNQEQNIFTKIYKLVIREFLWHKEIKREIKDFSSNNTSVLFVHTFSLYNVWSWLRLIPKLKEKNIKLFLLFRYSKILLPFYLKKLFINLCKKFPKPNKDLLYFTDSKQLASEYLKSSELELIVLPVMAKTDFEKQKKRQKDYTNLNITYLGCARNDKGFYHLPEIIKRLSRDSFNYDICIKIQATTPGTDFMEKKCSDALREIKLIKDNNKDLNIEIFCDQLNNNDYEDLLVSSNLILLPYTGKSYQIQTSGILIESMSNGIPCIVPDKTWMSEEISITCGGAIFNPNNVNDICEAVVKIINNYDHYRGLAEAGARHTKDNHGPVAQTRELVKCIEGVNY